MRRMILVVATSSLVLAIGPASALARHHSTHHKRHHARHHARVHRVTHRRFGDLSNPTTPTTTPGTTPSSDAVGTVDSFTNGTLTIKLNNGSTVSGMVTNETEIECSSAMSSLSSDLRRDGDGGNGSSGGSDGQDSQGDQNSGGSDDNGPGDDEGQQQACTSASLTSGASVRGAELKISSAGAVWDKVDLIS
jgi:hypothetical protein